MVYLLNWPLAKYDIYVRGILVSLPTTDTHRRLCVQLMRQSYKAADRRMNTVNELFQNIRFLKFYGWGEFFARGCRHPCSTSF